MWSLLFKNTGTKQILLKNTFWLGLVELFSKIVMLVVTITVVRYLGPEQYGIYNVALSYVSLFVIFSDFGFSTIATREISKDKEQAEKYLGNLLSLKFLISLVIVLIIFISLFVFKNHASTPLVLMAGLFLLGQNISNTFACIFTAMERMELVFFARIAYYLGILLSTIIVIKSMGGVIELVSAYFLITILLTFISVLLTLKAKITVRLDFDYSFIKELLVESIPLLGVTVVTTIYINIDTLLIGNFFGSKDVGFYQSAYKVLFAFQSVNILNNVLYPRINVLISRKNNMELVKLIKLTVSLSLIFLIPLAIIITYYQVQVMKLIYGVAYISAAPAMALLIWSGVICYFRTLASNILVAERRQSKVLLAMIIGLFSNLLINIFILPNFDFTYAAVALVISELVILTIMLFNVPYEKIFT